ncbi:MAG: polyprenyl synthetase family protein [Rickettsiaceae bacterium H1]|nr:polyprenyl synthetase family protein [Rickettsiaceae bacterium H1]
MNALLTLQKLLKPEFDRLNEVIAGHYENTGIPLIREVTENLVLAGGKRIRPLLTLILAKLFGCNHPGTIDAAAAIELIHTATLLHDDVVDEADTRRGNKTAKKLWGNKASILVGDFLLSAAFNSAISCNSGKVLTILSRATSVIAQGEVKQLMNIGKIDLTREEYSAVILAKTAELFAAACGFAATLAGEETEIWEEFGRSFGTAFQIRDDVIDYRRGSGKDFGNDFFNGKVTLPVIIACEQANYVEKKFWQESITKKKNQDLTAAIKQLEKYGALNESMKLARNYTENCTRIIEKLPNSELKNSLSGLIESIIE